MCATGPLEQHPNNPSQAAATVTSAETPNGWTLTLTCHHGATSVDLLRVDDTELGPFAFLLGDAMLRNQHEAAERCGCARRAVPR